MKTLGDFYGRDGTFKDRNPHFKGPNHRMDHIVKCPECDTGMSYADIPYHRINGRREWCCPHCGRIMDHVTSIIKAEAVME